MSMQLTVKNYSITEAFRKAIIVETINLGIFDPLLVSNTNKAECYHRLPIVFRVAMAQSTFYKFLSIRRISIHSNRILFFNACGIYWDIVEKTENKEMVSFSVIKYVSIHFKRYIEDHYKEIK